MRQRFFMRNTPTIPRISTLLSFKTEQVTVVKNFLDLSVLFAEKEKKVLKSHFLFMRGLVEDSAVFFAPLVT